MDELDLRLQDCQFQRSFVVQNGLQFEPKQRFADIVLNLGFGRAKRINPLIGTDFQKPKPYNLTQCLAELIKQGNLSEVIGSRVLCGKSVLYYTTLVSPVAKPYFSVYADLLKQIRVTTGMPIIVWLEDLISLPRFEWSIEATKSATTSTEYWFRNHLEDVQIGICSDSEGGIVPLDFIEATFQNFYLDEFLTTLPFHKHDLSVVCVNDVAHFIWSMYVSSCFHGLHLTATNNKRNYLMFRRLCGKQYSAAMIFPIS